MADIIFTNNASSLLNTTISAVDTTVELAVGFGTRFPSPSGAQYFLATLEDDQGNFEVVRCTSRTGDVLTVVRGQDNTTAQAFTQNVTRVELRLTAGVVSQFLQVNGGVMTGNLDMAANNIIDAVLSGGSTQMLAGEIVAVPLRGAAGVTTNEIAVPPSGRATAGGAALLVSGDDLIAELDTAGLINFNSATVGVKFGTGGGYHRITNAADDSYLQENSDGTNFNSAFTGLVDWVISGLTGDIRIGAGVDFDLQGNDILQANIVDFQFKSQSVSASTTTNIDYTLGSYVILTLDQTITTLNITNPPATQYAAVRFKLVQDGVGGRTITNWPAGTVWGNGTPPTIPGSPNDVFFVDLWTDNGGTTWYGGYGSGAWS